MLATLVSTTPHLNEMDSSEIPSFRCLIFAFMPSSEGRKAYNRRSGTLVEVVDEGKLSSKIQKSL